MRGRWAVSMYTCAAFSTVSIRPNASSIVLPDDTETFVSAMNTGRNTPSEMKKPPERLFYLRKARAVLYSRMIFQMPTATMAIAESMTRITATGITIDRSVPPAIMT